MASSGGQLTLSELRLHADDISRPCLAPAGFEPVRVWQAIQRRVISEDRWPGRVSAPLSRPRPGCTDVSLQARREKLRGQRPTNSDQADVELQLADRDRMDRERETSPMRIAPDGGDPHRQDVCRRRSISLSRCGLSLDVG
jgi:hypothetical protein